MSGRTSGRGKITHTNTKHHKQPEKETINPKQKTDRKRAERKPDTKGKTKDTRKELKRLKFCVFLAILKKSINKTDRIRAKEDILGRFKALSIYGAILNRPNQIKRRGALYLRACLLSGVRRCLDYRRARTRTGADQSGAGVSGKRGQQLIKRGRGYPTKTAGAG